MVLHRSQYVTVADCATPIQALPRYYGHIQEEAYLACLGVFMSKRRKFSLEFKLEAVKLTLQPGVSCRQIALEICVDSRLLSLWKGEARPIVVGLFKAAVTLVIKRSLV